MPLKGVSILKLGVQISVLADILSAMTSDSEVGSEPLRCFALLG